MLNVKLHDITELHIILLLLKTKPYSMYMQIGDAPHPTLRTTYPSVCHVFILTEHCNTAAVTIQELSLETWGTLTAFNRKIFRFTLIITIYLPPYIHMSVKIIQ